VQKSGDENLVAMVLETMAQTKNAAAVDFVRSVLFDQRRAATHAMELVAYFREMPELAGEQEALAFARIGSSTASADVRLAVIDALPALKPRLSSELRKALEPVVTASDRRLSEAGLVALANLGDKGSRRKLIDPYDERVKQNEEWSQAWVDRGDIYVRIGDNDAAIKDFVKAIQLGNDDGALKPDTYVKLARCYMRESRLKEAGYYVGRAPLSMPQRCALAEDPEFKPLRESKYGKEAFGECGG
jgi:tetratricopeptide (TPR) repeat protein